MQNGGAFHWFTGVVEDIQDPKEMGRIRVRCYGFHTKNKEDLPTESLPWASPMLPVTSASMTELGTSATGLLKGSWVIGFFRDGSNGQDPIVMGSIPSMSSLVDYQYGFTDPEKRYPVNTKLDIAETPLAAKSIDEAYKKAFSYTKKVELREAHDVVPTANAAHENDWKFPDIDSVIKPQYPKNHVIAYEKATDTLEDSHIVEFDVTPGQERISTIHRTGTYREITPVGDETSVIVGNDFQVVVKNQNVNVIGNCNLTVDSNCSTYIKGNWNIQVDGNIVKKVAGYEKLSVGLYQEEIIDGAVTQRIGSTLKQSTGGSVTEVYGGKLDSTILGNVSEVIGGSLKQSTGGSVTENYGGNQRTRAPNILLN